MKLAFVCNLQYMRRMDMSVATVLELGEPLESDDVLYDVVTGQRYEVASRGFSPKRSSHTVDRLHWSREASAAFRGNCQASNGRLLFAGDVAGLRCLMLTGEIASKNSQIPIDVPLVGVARLVDYDSPAILLVSDAMRGQLAILVKREDQMNSKKVDFLCTSSSKEIVKVAFSINAAEIAPETGQLLVWDEVDSPTVMQ